MKLDLAKDDKAYYTANESPEFVDFPPHKYLGIEGKGEPAGQEFSAAVEALYPVAYAVKNIYKAKELDFAVPKLEGLWWVESDLPAFKVPRQEWYWNLLIRLPDYIRAGDVDEAVQIAYSKKKLAKIGEISFQVLDEEKCVQVMHIGPYSAEAATIERMYIFIADAGYEPQGLHHEIYLTDPRTTAPEKMKTILRQPIGRR